MINKILLQSIINKYYLGINETVKWKISNGELEIRFMTPSQDVIGEIKCLNFPLKDSELAVFDTRKLLNLVSICNGDLLLELENINGINTKLKISDLNYNLDYALADPLLVGKVGTVNVPEWDITLEMSSEDVENLIKAKNALTGVDDMLITTDVSLDGEKICKFIFGGNEGHNNKISYQIMGKINISDLKLPFNSDIFKNILNFNRDVDGGNLYINKNGLIMLEFSTEFLKCKYYMYRQAEL